MSVGMSRGEKSVCLGDTDVILGRKMTVLHWGAVEKMEKFLYLSKKQNSKDSEESKNINLTDNEK